jgi:DNA replication protein DnaC
MTSPTSIPTNDLVTALDRIGLTTVSENLDDLVARSIKGRWSPQALLEEICRLEECERARRSLERRLQSSRIGRFKLMADFDWNWPAEIDRDLIERSLTLDFVREGRNLVLVGNNGLGKTMIAKNIAHAAVLAGYSVLFRSAADILEDLLSYSPEARRRKLRAYARPSLLCIDEVGYLSYDSNAADMLYQVVNRRYEQRSILITTNKSFKEWNQVFPNASCIVTLLDRMTHHADITVIRGKSYRVRESEQEASSRRKKS